MAPRGSKKPCSLSCGKRPAKVTYLGEEYCYECAWRLRERYEVRRVEGIRDLANRLFARLHGLVGGTELFDTRITRAHVTMEQLGALAQVEYVDERLRNELYRAEGWAREAWYALIDERIKPHRTNATADFVKKAVG